MADTVQIPFDSYGSSVPKILDRIRASGLVADAKRILIKPNLVNDSPFPVTTAPAFCREVILWLQARSRAELIIAEGCDEMRHAKRREYIATAACGVLIILLFWDQYHPGRS